MLDIVVDQVCSVVRRLPVLPDTAAVVHARVLTALREAGFDVEAEVTCSLPDGAIGRYDLVVSRGWMRVAIEIDARKPRRKSLEKLRQFDGGRVVILRGVGCAWRFDGIDAVVPLKVRIATDREIANKKAVSIAARAKASAHV